MKPLFLSECDGGVCVCHVLRLGQQEAELKNGGMVGGARDVLGSWLQDGRQLLLERDRKLAEDAAGRLTG